MTSRTLHLIYLVSFTAVLIVMYIMFATWRSEHDARLLAEQQAKVAEEHSKVTEAQVAQRDAVRDATIAALQKAAARVRTAPQAVAALPTTAPELHPIAVASNPAKVEVDALPLFAEINKCQQDAVKLATCEADDLSLSSIIVDKDAELVVLKQKPKFWKRIKSGGKKVGIGIGIGALLVAML